MPYELDNRLVIGVASSAVFDLRESDAVFKSQGEEEYRKFQEQNLKSPLPKGIAYPFIKRLLSLNDLSVNPSDPLVEVVLLSRNDPDTGLRVMKTIEYYGLPMTRAIFMQGKSPYEYIPALNIALFLSGNKSDVESAIMAGHPAGQVLDSQFNDDEDDKTLRIAFDFDGVLADDESETVMQSDGLTEFHAHELKNVMEPHHPGPLKEFMVRMSKIQSVEEEYKKLNPDYQNRIRVSIVTARNAPSHERAMNTLKSWGVMANDAFFLGGIEKGRVLGILKPHIFFDDQSGHLKSASAVAPSVHIPFGITNQRKIDAPLEIDAQADTDAASV
ncbi:5'-nucleotidase [Pseudomonas syringae group genomosp. 3]|uniref:5'-nucleotidase n=1 Tax=Pseudomonas syringae pv. primulae TaxID=251707 RepID=A0A3M5U434_9PSED|nr:5'-nucleotidase [Pseudomonas syringae group genomosp. 3]RMO74721.1 5'-nucleotidase [Pseudomonas syringae pv. primulae]RMR14005.1 5'-nucleotidase [Pseudomonas syringae pv. primulae]RMU40314.1 5'-nucleotidase [Pseudomonas syringae pv. primulae]